MPKRKSKILSTGTDWGILLISAPFKIKNVVDAYCLVVKEGELIVCCDVIEGKDINRLSWLIEKTFMKPLIGRPRKPKKVIFENRTPLNDIQISLRDVVVEIGKISGLDEFLDSFMQRMQGGLPKSPFDYKDYPEELMRRFFEITYIWAEEEIWDLVPDSYLVKVNSERYNIKNSLVSIMGNAGQSFGLMVFSSEEAYKSMILQSHSSSPKLKLDLLVLNYMSIKEAEEYLVEAMFENEWPVSDPDFFPVLETYHTNQTVVQAEPKSYAFMIELIEMMLGLFERLPKDEKLLTLQKKHKMNSTNIQIEFPFFVQ